MNKVVLSFFSICFSFTASAVHIGSAKVGGLLQFDEASFSGDTDTVSRSSVDVRRADLWVKGDLHEKWSYQFGYDARYNLLNASWIGYGGIDYFWLAMGFVDIPQSLDYWSSYTYSTFMEYASPVFAMQPHKGVGVYVDAIAFKDLLSYQVALYTPDIYEEETVQVLTRADIIGEDSDQWAIAGRAIFHPDFNISDVFHIGAYGRFEGVSDSTQLNPLVTTPGVFGRQGNDSDRSNVFVTSIQPKQGTVEAVTAWGIEWAGLWGPVTAQSEYLGMFWQGEGKENDSVSFWGWYAQVAYLVTGETRAYDKYSAIVGNVKDINHNYGAWELAVRYAFTDLSHFAGDGYSETNVIDFTEKRGKQGDWAVGVNWYILKNVKLQANFTYAMADYAKETMGDQLIKAMAIRAQVDF